MEYKLVRYSDKYIQPLTTLLDSSFAIKNKEKRELVRWKMFGSYSQLKTITYLALDKSGTVVAQYTNFPVGMGREDKKYKGMICMDMTTHSAHRGKGLITALAGKVYEQVRKNGFDFTIGFSNDAGVQVDKNSRNYGYNVVGKFARYFKIAVFRKEAEWNLSLTDDFDNHWQQDKKSEYFRYLKNYDYLKWRYKDKPNNDYLIYKLEKNGKIGGYVVLKCINKRCYVCDILIGDNSFSQIKPVLRAVENLAFKKGCYIVIYNVLDNKYWQKLFKQNYYWRKTLNKDNYYLTIKIHNQKLDRDLILDKNNWWLINGDIL